MKILVDSNVILDVLQMRDAFLSDSYRVLSLCTEDKVEGYAAAHTITNLHYILRKDFKPVERRETVLGVFNVLDIVEINSEMLKTALENFEFKDFEDCLQDECAAKIEADYIVTRNVKDFENSKIPAVTPEDFMQILEE